MANPTAGSPWLIQILSTASGNRLFTAMEGVDEI